MKMFIDVINFILKIVLSFFLTSLFIADTKQAAVINYQFESHVVKVDGTEIFYRTCGEGPHLVMLHGYTLTGELWSPFVDELSQNHTLVIIDLPGHGRSGAMPGGHSFEKYAEVIYKLLDIINVNEFDAVGHSAGAITFLHMVKKNSDRIKSMVLIGCGHKFSKESLEFSKTDTFENLSEKAKEFYRFIHPRGDKQTKELYDELMPILESYNNFNIYSSEFKNICTRSLIILGDRDLYFPAEFVAEMYNVLPNSQLWIIPNAGHLPVWGDMGGSSEAASIFTDVVLRFLNADESRTVINLN